LRNGEHGENAQCSPSARSTQLEFIYARASSFKKHDVSAHEPGEPDQEHNEECCAERCRSDAEKQGVRNAFHQLADTASIGSLSAGRRANGLSSVLADFELLKLSREKILGGVKLGCLCCS
jgi:hypothetical protein